MDDQRPAILMQEDFAKFIPPRGYVEDVAAGIALATASPRAAGRVYNIAAAHDFSELDWARKIGDAIGWKGALIPAPAEQLPGHLRMPFNAEQHWVVSSKRIREELGFVESVSLDAGIQRTIAWERSNPPAIEAKLFDYAAEDAALQQLTSAGRSI